MGGSTDEEGLHHVGVVGAEVIELAGKIGGDSKGELLPVLVGVQGIAGDMLGAGVPITLPDHKGMTTGDVGGHKLIDGPLL